MQTNDYRLSPLAAAAIRLYGVARQTTNRDDVIAAMRAGLKARSGKPWSVTGGRGTAWGWITVSAPPARRVNGNLSDADRAELGELLGFGRPVHQQGESIAASSDYYREYLYRSAGLAPTTTGRQYWD